MSEPGTSTITSTTTITRSPLVITSFPSIPLTTTFTPPGSACGALYDPANDGLLIIDDQPSCLPSGFSTSDSAFFFSPGIACPSGYRSACHGTEGVASITTVTCCPTYGSISLSCVPDPLSLQGVWETLFCTWRAPASPGTEVIVTMSGDGRTSFEAVRVTDPGGINAYGVRMVHQATDLLAASTTSTSGVSPQSTTTNPATTPNTTTTTTTTTSSTLSTGAIAAIGVVVPLTVIALCVAGFFLWRRRRLQTQQQQQSPTLSSSLPEATTVAGGPEYHQSAAQAGQKPPGVGEYYYYGNQAPQEMPGAWSPPEMPSSMAAAELPGQSAGRPPTYYG